MNQFDTELEAIVEFNSLVIQCRKVRERFERAGMRLPESLARCFGGERETRRDQETRGRGSIRVFSGCCHRQSHRKQDSI